jgi:hypothetical protein
VFRHLSKAYRLINAAAALRENLAITSVENKRALARWLESGQRETRRWGGEHEIGKRNQTRDDKYAG